MSWVQHLKQLIDRYHLARDHDVATYRQLIELGKMSDSLAHSLVMMLAPEVEKQKRCPNLLPPPPTTDELGCCDLEIGEVIDNPGVRVGISLSDRPRHVIASGITGSGKSNLLRVIAKGIKHDVSVIVIDTKSVFPDIKDTLGRARCDHYSLFDGFKLGLNAPADLRSDVWANQMAKIIAARSGLIMAEGSLGELLRVIRDALGKNLWPSIPLLYEVLSTTPLEAVSSKADYAKTLLQALRILMNESCGALDTLCGFDVIKHVVEPGRSCVLDLGTGSPRITGVIVDTIILQLLIYRLYQRQTRDLTDVVLIIDEADPFVSKEVSKKYPDGMSPLATLLKQGREFGIMVVLGVSFLGQADQMIRANATYHAAFAQPDNQSGLEAARTLMVPPGGEGIFATLQPGTCVFREATGSFPYPMLVKTDFVPPSRMSRPTQFDLHPFVPGKSLDELPQLQSRLDDLVGHSRSQKQRTAAKKGLSKEAEALLNAAARHWWVPEHYLWPKTGLHPSPDKKTRVHNELESTSCAVLHKCRFGKANVIFIDVTDKGWEAIQQTKQKRPGRGNLPHCAICHWIKLVGERQGFSSSTEWQVTGTNHPVDVAWQSPNGVQAFEVCMSATQNLTSHLTACFVDSTAVSGLTIVLPLKNQIDKVKKAVERQQHLASYLYRVKYDSVSTFMAEELFK